MEDICEVCGQNKHCIALDVEWTTVGHVCEECLKELEEEYR